MCDYNRRTTVPVGENVKLNTYTTGCENRMTDSPLMHSALTPGPWKSFLRTKKKKKVSNLRWVGATAVGERRTEAVIANGARYCSEHARGPVIV